MIKRILKTAIVLLSLGTIATPVLAAEWGVSGQVRVDWDVYKTIESKNGTLPDDDGGGKKRVPAGVTIDDDDSWVSFDLKGDNGSASFLYYIDGRQEYVGSASAKAGSWAASAKVSVRNDANQDEVQSLPRSGNNVDATKAGDQTVEVKHDGGFSLKIGKTTPLDSYRQGKGYLLIGEDGDSAHVTEVATGGDLGALDNRTNVAKLGYDIGDNIKIGVTFEAADSRTGLGGKAFQSIGYGSYGSVDPSSDISSGVNQNGLGNLGINVNLGLGIIDLGFVLINAGEKSDPDLGSADNEYEATASSFGLGVGVNLGNIVPYLNIWNPSSTSKNDRGEDETVSSATQIGVGIGFGESSGIGVSIVNRASTRTTTPIATKTEEEDKTTTSTFELGYSTNLGGATFQAAFDSATFKYEDPNKTESEVTVSWIKLRLQQSF